MLYAKDAFKKSDEELSSLFLAALSNIEAIIAQEIAITEKAWLMQELDQHATNAQLLTAINGLSNNT